MSNSKQKDTKWQKNNHKTIILNPLELHIWRANIHISQEKAKNHYHLLSPDEKTRAEKFKFEKHRLRFIAARSALRKILAHYLDMLPNDIIFTANEHGKPMLANHVVQNPLFFNLSHSHDIAVYAISHQPDIGIDIEYVKEDIEPDAIAKRFFSDNESSLLTSIPLPQKVTAFFKIWTAKEAFIKAIGEGLSFPLKNFDMFLSDSKITLHSIYGDTEKAQEWSLFSIDVAEKYEANVAIKAPTPAIKLWQFSD